MRLIVILLIGFMNVKATAQESPIHWINNTFTVNLDTLNFKHVRIQNHSSSLNPIHNLTFYFTNKGKQITYVDSVFGNSMNDQSLAKPGETQNLSITFDAFSFAYHSFRDTSLHFFIPFYYQGRIYSEKLTCHFTFGKSKLIAYDYFITDLTDTVQSIIDSDTTKPLPSLSYTHYFKVKNISNKPIHCTHSFIAWNDAQHLRNRSNAYHVILPGETYLIPAQLYMDRKYRFSCSGGIHVYNEDTSEIYHCAVFTKIDPRQYYNRR